MAKGVFLHRPDSIYDDWPTERYQFPKQYLGRASQCVGDWIIYYEPRRSGTGKGYYAIAQVEQIVPDPSVEGMFLALIAPRSYLPFEKSVAFSDADGLAERGLLNEAGRISGRAQAAVRPISVADFERILERGIPDGDIVLPRAPATIPGGLMEHQAAFVPEIIRERVDHYGSRIVRDRVFRTLVLDAYDRRCAITGLKLINGGGRAEVEAAHIVPVEHDGPDIISNGLALSGTAHWMFDRGLISLSNDLEILLSRQVNDIEGARGIINKSGYAIAPLRPESRPHPRFLKWHRESCFKG